MTGNGQTEPMPVAIYTRSHIISYINRESEMCPALTDLVTKLFQIHDFISCCDDERDKILYFASKDNTRHCLVRRKACRVVLELELLYPDPNRQGLSDDDV